jgi:hypothetical protein
MRNVLVYLIFFTCLIGCKHRNVRSDSLSKTKFPEVERQKDINVLIRTIESSDALYGKAVGINGETNFVYSSFERLSRLASDSLWFKLSYSSSPVMRAYAYDALKSKNQLMALDVANRLKDDTTKIRWISSDMSITCSVNYYIAIK